MDSANISDELLACLKLFNTLLLDDGLLQASSGMPKSPWIDELGRLRIWAANIGAHQKGLSSLDYRLRDASHIKTQIVNLLRSLKRALRDLEEVLTILNRNDAVPRDEHKDSQDSDEDDEDNEEDENDTMAEVEDIFLHITEIISDLYRMSMLVRQPSQQDRLLRYRKDDALGYEPFDRNHVLEKFPKADSSVIENLGAAISNRRRDLKALERHRAKLAKGIGHAHLDHHDGASTLLSGTLATDYKEEGETARLETESVSAESATSYASSFLAGNRTVKVPAPPFGYGSEQPFECPYCFLITTADSRKSWARHVFRDLRPYLCVFPHCSTPTQMYDRRRDWFLHLQKNHLPAVNFKTVPACPLCGKDDLLYKQVEHHLAAHLEELALFALPRDMQDEEDDEVDHDAATMLKETPVSQGEDSDTSHISDEDYRSLNGRPDGENLSPQSIDAAEIDWEASSMLDTGSELPKEVEQLMIAQLSQNAVDTADHANEGEHLASKSQTGKGAEQDVFVAPDKLSQLEEIQKHILKLQEKRVHSFGAPTAAVREDEAGTRAPIFAAGKKLKWWEEVTKSRAEAEEILATARAVHKPHEPEPHFLFTDALGRKHLLLLEKCCRWMDMESMIHKVFVNVDGLAEPVKAGRYDLFAPRGHLVLPSEWESIIKPDMVITMSMWDESLLKEYMEVKTLAADDSGTKSVSSKRGRTSGRLQDKMDAYTQGHDKDEKRSNWARISKILSDRRILSQSRSMPRMDSSELDMDDKLDVPAGELPPISNPGQFLRRKRED